MERLVLLPAATRLTAPGVKRIDLGLGRRVGVRLLLRVVGFLQLPVQVSGLVAQDENMPETAAPVTSSAPCSSSQSASVSAQFWKTPRVRPLRTA